MTPALGTQRQDNARQPPQPSLCNEVIDTASAPMPTATAHRRWFVDPPWTWAAQCATMHILQNSVPAAATYEQLLIGWTLGSQL